MLFEKNKCSEFSDQIAFFFAHEIYWAYRLKAKYFRLLFLHIFETLSKAIKRNKSFLLLFSYKNDSVNDIIFNRKFIKLVGEGGKNETKLSSLQPFYFYGVHPYEIERCKIFFQSMENHHFLLLHSVKQALLFSAVRT